MPRATYFTARLDDLEFMLCHRTPHWEFTVQNHTDATQWINRWTPLPAGGTYTICRRTRTPAFGLQINGLTLEVDAMRVTVAKGATADFIEVPSRGWHSRSHVLPLEVSVYGTASGASTAVQYRNTSATDTLTLGGDLLLSPGETRTFTGKPWDPFGYLHDIYAKSAAGATYYCVTNVGHAGVYLAVHEWDAPAPAPHFDAPSFYAHVLQQLRYRDPALLTDILRTQGFTAAQIAAFEDSVAEL